MGGAVRVRAPAPLGVCPQPGLDRRDPGAWPELAASCHHPATADTPRKGVLLGRSSHLFMRNVEVGDWLSLRAEVEQGEVSSKPGLWGCSERSRAGHLAQKSPPAAPRTTLKVRETTSGSVDGFAIMAITYELFDHRTSSGDVKRSTVDRDGPLAPGRRRPERKDHHPAGFDAAPWRGPGFFWQTTGANWTIQGTSRREWPEP